MRRMLGALVFVCVGACSAGGGLDAGTQGDAGGSFDGAMRFDANRVIPDAGFMACETTTAFADPLPATLLFTVDTSGSMNCRADMASCAVGDPTPDPSDSRYDVFRSVLRTALSGLPDSTLVGAMHYPVTFSCARDELLVDIASLGTTRTPIDDALGGVVPEGITPTHDAVRFGLAQLGMRGSDEARHLVLATDGAATVCIGCDAACSFDALDRDHEDMIAEVRAAAELSSIRTFVIGVPGSSSYRSILSRMATAAGTARPGCSDTGPTYCHYDLTDPSLDFGVALRDALGEIGEAVLSCEYTIPENPDGTFDATRVNVRLTEGGATSTIRRDPSRASGWDYSDDGSTIVLHGDACSRAQAASDGRIDVLFGCPTELI